MKKILKLITLNSLIISMPVMTISCSNNTLLDITNQDIYDTPGNPGKIDDIAFHYIFELPPDKKAEYPKNYFKPNWDWNLNNRKKIIGYNDAGISGEPAEYWMIKLEKTKAKGIFVFEYEKSNKPIKNAD